MWTQPLKTEFDLHSPQKELKMVYFRLHPTFFHTEHLEVLDTLLIIQGGGRNYHPLSENRDFSGTEPLLDLRQVCKF